MYYYVVKERGRKKERGRERERERFHNSNQEIKISPSDSAENEL